MTEAVRSASFPIDRLRLDKRYVQTGQLPRSILELTPTEFRLVYLPRDQNRDATDDATSWGDAVARGVIRKNDQRGAAGLSPVIAAEWRKGWSA